MGKAFGGASGGFNWRRAKKRLGGEVAFRPAPRPLTGFQNRIPPVSRGESALGACSISSMIQTRPSNLRLLEKQRRHFPAAGSRKK